MRMGLVRSLELVPVKRRHTDVGYFAADRPPTSVSGTGVAPRAATGGVDVPAGASRNVEASRSTESTPTVVVSLTPANPNEVTEGVMVIV